MVDRTWISDPAQGGAPPENEGPPASLPALVDMYTASPGDAGSGPATAEGRAEGTLARGASIGRYLILSPIGRGGMGEVYEAYDPELDRRVALKLLHTAHGPSAARRLLAREARALGKLSHPNVVQVHDVGEHQGDVFVAMELVEGESLDAWIRRRPRPAWREVLAVYLDAARGLSAAHAKGLVHRDVKPSNILRGSDGRVRVCDFGLAAGAGDEIPPGAPSAPTVVVDGPRSAPGSAEPSFRAAASGAASSAAPSSPGAGASPEGEAPRRAEVLSFDETMPLPSGSGDPPDGRLTAPGIAMGTPLYMAPEQHLGTRVGPASDQYALCASLYEALYEAPPFPLKPNAVPVRMMAQILVDKRHGPPPPPAAGSGVPGWVYKALARGLAPEPAARWPSLDALVEALARDPDAPRRARRRTLAAALSVLGLSAIAAAGWARSGVFRDPCAHPEQQLAGAWDEGVKGQLRAAFMGTGRSYAEGTVTRVAALLDRYGAEWAAMRGEVCDASRRDRLRREVLALRSECLDRRRGQLHALTTLLAERPDPEVLDKAVQAAAALPPIAFCAETEALTARVRPPEDPALRARVAALEPRVDRLEVLHTAGKYKEGLALGRPLLSETQGLRYPPLVGRIQLWMGRLEERTGDNEGARGHLRDAAVSAAEGRDDLLGAAAWARLLFVVGDRQQRFEEAAVIRSLGPTAVARAQDDASQATWLNAEGTLLFRAGKFADARATHERALALWEKALGPDHPDVAVSLNNLANAVFQAGDYPRALATHERALGVWEKALGEGHPLVATSLNNLGNVLSAMGAFPRARSVHEAALSLREKALGAGHPYVATSLVNLGTVLLRMGEAPEALAAFQRAEAVWEKTLAPDHPDRSYALSGEGRAEARLGRLDAALSHLERALRVREAGMGKAHPALAEALLGLGEVHLARRAPAESVPHLERALSLENAEERTEIQLVLADALWAIGSERRPRARELAEEARAAAERIGHRPWLARAERWLAEHPREGGKG